LRSVIVTGAAGFLGGNVAAEFERQGWRVFRCGRGRSGRATPAGFLSISLPGDELVALIKQEQPDLCVHCAGTAEPRVSLLDPERDFVNGPQLTHWLLETLRKHSPASRVVFPSSAAVYGDASVLPISEEAPKRPISPYGYHKLESELVLESYRRVFGLTTVALRIFSAYGPGLHRQVVWDLLGKIASGQGVAVEGTGAESRDFIFGADVARAVFHVATMEAPEAVYNLATGVETTIAELVKVLLSELRLDREVRFTRASPAGVPRNWRADISRLRGTGWSPAFGFEEGIRLTIESWKRGEGQR